MAIDFDRITNPLVLGVGTHKAGTGVGCGMNVVSWTSGDTTITDFPACSHPMLSVTVQMLNDTLGNKYGRLATIGGKEYQVLTPRDAQRVLDLGYRTVGTGSVKVPSAWIVWVLEQYRMKAQFNGNDRRIRMIDVLIADRPWEDTLHALDWIAANRLGYFDMGFPYRRLVLAPNSPEAALDFAWDIPLQLTEEAVDKFREFAGLDEPQSVDTHTIDAALAKMGVVQS